MKDDGDISIGANEKGVKNDYIKRLTRTILLIIFQRCLHTCSTYQLCYQEYVPSRLHMSFNA